MDDGFLVEEVDGRGSSDFRLSRRVASSMYFEVECGEEKGEGAPESL
jgi:hypothetical protein